MLLSSWKRIYHLQLESRFYSRKHMPPLILDSSSSFYVWVMHRMLKIEDCRARGGLFRQGEKTLQTSRTEFAGSGEEEDQSIHCGGGEGKKWLKKVKSMVDGVNTEQVAESSWKRKLIKLQKKKKKIANEASKSLFIG